MGSSGVVDRARRSYWVGVAALFRWSLYRMNGAEVPGRGSAARLHDNRESASAGTGKRPEMSRALSTEAVAMRQTEY